MLFKRRCLISGAVFTPVSNVRLEVAGQAQPAYYRIVGHPSKSTFVLGQQPVNLGT